MPKKPVSKVKKNIARAFLITGMVFSILGFLASIVLLFLYFGIYALLVMVLIIAALVIFAGVGIVLLFIYLLIGIFAAMFGATDWSLPTNIFPSTMEQVIPADLIERFGYDSLIYLIGLPIILTIITISFVSMVYAIVALCLLNGSKGKAGGIVGGIFAIFSSFTGLFSPLEFAGGVIMFFISKEEYMLGHEEPKKVKPNTKTVKRPMIDYTKQ